jgi:hypothetical protein
MVPAPGDGPGDTPWKELRVGDMWFAPHLLTTPHAMFKPSPNYARDHAGKRLPLMVRLPGVSDFSIDGMAWKDGQTYGDGWTVTGEAPLITVTPSINIVGSYHGHLQNGIITDEVEGRKYDEFGHLIVRL